MMDAAAAREEEEARVKLAARPPGVPFQLPPPSRESRAQVISVGEGVSLHELGPLVIHKDGTTSRIQGWSQKTKWEQERILRVLGTRNAERSEKLLAKGQKVKVKDDKRRTANPHRQ